MPKAPKRVLCDTCILIQIFRNNQTILAELDRLGFSRLYISSVTVGEIYRGMHKREKRATKSLLDRFNIYQLNTATSLRFEQLMAAHPEGRLQLADGLIAAAAIEGGFQLYTENRKDFDFLPGMRLHNPQPLGPPPKASQVRRSGK